MICPRTGQMYLIFQSEFRYSCHWLCGRGRRTMAWTTVTIAIISWLLERLLWLSYIIGNKLSKAAAGQTLWVLSICSGLLVISFIGGGLQISCLFGGCLQRRLLRKTKFQSVIEAKSLSLSSTEYVDSIITPETLEKTRGANNVAALLTHCVARRR